MLIMDIDYADIYYNLIMENGDYRIYEVPDGWYYLTYKEYVVCKSDLSVCAQRMDEEIERDEKRYRGKISNKRKRTRKDSGEAVSKASN